MDKYFIKNTLNLTFSSLAIKKTLIKLILSKYIFEFKSYVKNEIYYILIVILQFCSTNLLVNI